MTRLEANREIVKKIAEAAERHPEWRFNQLLQNMNLEARGEDRWYVESETALSGIDQYV